MAARASGGQTPRAITQEAWYVDALGAFERNGAGHDPAWLMDLRRDAIARFQALGFPTARRGNEPWKYTDVRSLANTPFETAPEPPSLRPSQVKHLTLPAKGAHRLTFVNGVHVPALSTPSPASAAVLSLAEAMTADAEAVRSYLAQHAAYQDEAFTALNTAFIHDGACVRIPEDTTQDAPVHLLFISAPQEEASVAHPRVLIVAGARSNASLLLSYEALGAGVSHETLGAGRAFTNTVVEVIVGAGALLELVTLQGQAEDAYHIATTQVVQARDSHFASVTVDLGGGTVRNNLGVLLDDEGAGCSINGLYVTGNEQTSAKTHVDNHTFIDHAKPHTTSREVYKGVVDGNSRAVFMGRVLVRHGAQGTDASQVNKNLLLSEGAEVDSQPVLEIFADDVKCTHGSAIGRLDEAAMFYLKSRGLAEESARRLLMQGFVEEVTASISQAAVRKQVESAVLAKLGGGR